jgi:hypothetical protein
MLGKKVRIQPLMGSKDMNICHRANGENGCCHSTGPFSWYLARCAVPEMKYVLTINGYIILP